MLLGNDPAGGLVWCLSIFLVQQISAATCGKTLTSEALAEIPQNASLVRCNKKQTKCFYACDEYGYNLYREHSNRWDLEGNFMCRGTKWVRWPKITPVCKKQACFKGMPLRRSSWQLIESDIDTGFHLAKVSITRQQVRAFKKSQGWTLNVHFTRPLTSGTFRALNGRFENADEAGSAISVASQVRNRDVTVHKFGMWGNSQKQHILIMFEGVKQELEFHNAYLYNEEYTNVACINDGGTFEESDGNPWESSAIVPSKMLGVQPFDGKMKCPDNNECPACQTCQACPETVTCPACKDCQSCPAAPACATCPTCPEMQTCAQNVCPTAKPCPVEKTCPVCKDNETDGGNDTDNNTNNSTASKSCKASPIGSYRYNVIYVSHTTNGIVDDIKECVDNKFNIIMLAFWMGATPIGEAVASGDAKGSVDAMRRWVETSQANRDEALKYAHDRGVKIMLSLGGGTDHIEDKGLNTFGEEFGRLGAEMAKRWKLDGVDFDLELRPGQSQYFAKTGTGVATAGYMHTFLVDSHKAARKVLPASEGYLLSHAPMGPYVSTAFATDEGYLRYLKAYQHEIDFFSVQYYNQETYTQCTQFTDKSPKWPGSSLKEIMDYGIAKEKIVLGKPIAIGAGQQYIDPATLHQCGCTAIRNYGGFGGWMTWMFRYGNDASLHRTWGNSFASKCGTYVPDCDSNIPIQSGGGTGDSGGADNDSGGDSPSSGVSAGTG